MQPRDSNFSFLCSPLPVRVVLGSSFECAKSEAGAPERPSEMFEMRSARFRRTAKSRIPGTARPLPRATARPFFSSRNRNRLRDRDRNRPFPGGTARPFPEEPLSRRARPEACSRGISKFSFLPSPLPVRVVLGSSFECAKSEARAPERPSEMFEMRNARFRRTAKSRVPGTARPFSGRTARPLSSSRNRDRLRDRDRKEQPVPYRSRGSWRV